MIINASKRVKGVNPENLFRENESENAILTPDTCRGWGVTGNETRRRGLVVLFNLFNHVVRAVDGDPAPCIKKGVGGGGHRHTAEEG